MSRGSNIFSGGAFKSAFGSLAGFLIVLAALGGIFYSVVTSAMERELDNQITEEQMLFQDVYERDGLNSLIEAISRLEKPAISGSRAMGLFDENGQKLAGNLDTLPDLTGWQTQTFENLLPSISGTYRLLSTKLNGDSRLTLVLGQDTRLIELTRRTLLISLCVAGALVALLSITTGFFISMLMFGKLQTVSKTLEKVSHGDIASRIPIGQSNDQIDRVSKQINQHLERLAIVTTSTKNTINAVAHDLRSPINRAILMLQNLGERHTDNAPLISDLEDVSQELTRITKIFETILRISRIEATQSGTHFSNVNLKELILDIVETYEPVLEMNGQTLEFTLPIDRDALIDGDRAMLFQLLANLIENFSKHTPPGSKAHLTTTQTADRGWMLTVSDNGPGIAAAFHEDALKPFQRMEQSRSTPGNGLGLALVNAIVVHHGATIKLSDAKPGLRIDIAFTVSPNLIA